MLIAISGSQGSGKSTILHELKRLGYNTIERKTSRTVLDRWDKTLTEIYSDPQLHEEFQNELFCLKSSDEREAFESDEVWFTERTYADLFCYALFNLGNLNEHSNFIDGYYESCKYNNHQYNKTFYLESGHFQVEHDGVRGVNQYYSKAMDRIMMDTTIEMTTKPNTFEVIATPSIDKRIQLILQSLESNN
jgi:predicted ATPase